MRFVLCSVKYRHAVFREMIECDLPYIMQRDFSRLLGFLFVNHRILLRGAFIPIPCSVHAERNSIRESWFDHLAVSPMINIYLFLIIYWLNSKRIWSTAQYLIWNAL